MYDIAKSEKPCECDIARRERTLDTFAAHMTRRSEYSLTTDTILNFALKTGYDIDDVRQEREFRDLV